MRYLSVCSGIEAATVAWHPLGWTPVAFSEIEPFPAAVLAHHYPNVPNYGDMTKHKEWPLGPGSIDLLVGGTPCQAFSVAGLRGGLSDPRGGLMLTYLEIAQRLRPRWIVWENVPGVLSSGGGRDFGSFLGALGELRYGWAYRVIDAQYCRVDGRWPKAVPQRRRRVFVVGCDLERDPGGRERAAEVLALGTGLRWHLEESGKTRKAAPSDAEAGVGAGGWMPNNPGVVSSVCTKWSKGTGGPSGSEHFNLVTHPSWPAEVVPTQRCSAGRGADDQRTCVAIVGTDLYNGAITGEVAATMGTPGSSVNASGPTVMQAHAMTVRRLTPQECERLQAFPDDYTLIPWRRKSAADCPDGPRYKALGNSMAVNCMAWIGERIAAVEANNGAASAPPSPPTPGTGGAAS